MSAFFLTGTDTDVGKTVITAGLLAAARRKGLSTAAGKPVASGCEPTAHGLRNADALALQAQCAPPIPYEAINPVALAPAVAPHIAAREAGVSLSVSMLEAPMRALLARNADFTVIEGAGGWRVPLDDRESLSDLAVALGLPVVLVVGVRLGTINHARLTWEAIRQDGLKVAGWVANLIDPEMPRQQENLDSLTQWLSEQGGVPRLGNCLGIVPCLQTPSAERVADSLDISALLAPSAESDNPQ